MSHFLKTVAREVIVRTPVLRESFFDYEFARHEQSFRGIYDSFSEALDRAPAGKLTGYDHEEVAFIDRPNLDRLNSADYPVLFWLSRILPQAPAVFDLGGNLGVAYYAYRRHLEFPAKLHWTVCEVSETARAGRELAEEKGEKQLAFTDDRKAAPEADIFFTAGALQYIDEPVTAILAARPKRPRHVLIQRVPLSSEEPFITLQNNGAWIVPYKVENETTFIASVKALGYELVDHWRTARKLQVLMYPLSHEAIYQGMYFRLR
jgi:putative methyltransferase (TIGR04325 family)